jgi:hypothetical protein
MSSSYNQRYYQTSENNERARARLDERSKFRGPYYSNVRTDDFPDPTSDSKSHSRSRRRSQTRPSLTLTIAGAIAGGLVARKLGDNTLTSLAGAAVGAYGARKVHGKKRRSV